MGKRVNLADLAVDDLDFPGPAVPTAQWTVPAETNGAAAAQPIRVVPIGTVTLNPLNKRPAGGDDELAELAETIREHGVIQPLVVCSAARYLGEFPDQREPIGDAQWVVLIGNRRLRAARMAPLTEVTIVVNDEQVTSMYEVMLVENGQRKDLPPVLEAEAMAEVLKDASVSRRELARRIGKSHMYVTQRLALLKLVPELRALFERGELTIERAREFGELPEAEQRAIVAAGPPYRRSRGNGVISRAAVKSIRVSSPAAAAETIRQTFSPEELAELIRLLSED
uniref:ParB/RepB/Spo0J family partition protein n=1 Tax=Pseudonocardia sp. CA-138482 TaxID=3240023 RepID=UPI003F4954F6